MIVLYTRPSTRFPSSRESDASDERRTCLLPRNPLYSTRIVELPPCVPLFLSPYSNSSRWDASRNISSSWESRACQALPLHRPSFSENLVFLLSCHGLPEPRSIMINLPILDSNLTVFVLVLLTFDRW